MEEVQILYPDFLEDEAIYDELQNYWNELISAPIKITDEPFYFHKIPQRRAYEVG